MKYIPLVISLALLGAGCSAVQPPPHVSGDGAPVPVVATGGTELDLHAKGLTSIPPDVYARTELQKLDLSDNRLSGAPQAEIGHLRALRSLDLSGNALTGLPAELGQLSELEVLDVSGNQLTGLPMELGNLAKLRVLDISGNAYSKVDLDRIAAKLPNAEIRR